MHSIYLFFIILSMHICISSTFNLSPKPNMVIVEPTLKTYQPKIQSSLFGYSMNLMTNSILIGAPRAQSTLESQRNINETGAVYKCLLSTGECIPYNFDVKGNTLEEYNEFAFNSEKKDEQWLGAVMDGGPSEADRFVVCAPRQITPIRDTDYLMHGQCYWTPNTEGAKPTEVFKIAPLRLRSKQQKRPGFMFYMLGQEGISVHLSENNEEILIGAPGVAMWKGTIIRHRSRIPDEIGGIARRDVTPRQVVEYETNIPDPDLFIPKNDSYFGYAVSSGYFEGPDINRLLYVASAPQSNLQQGEVYVFDIVQSLNNGDQTIKTYVTLQSQQMGEYFGYALCSDDFNNDGYTDIIVSAPFHRLNDYYENGVVYVYINEASLSNGKWSNSFKLQIVLSTDYEFSGRFGTVLSRIGDINQDGYNDLAVAAPFEDEGAVYIYLGNPVGLSAKPSQRIAAPPNELTTPSWFGYGISKGVDIDANNFGDLVFSSPNIDKVFLYKSYPTVRIRASITPSSREIKITAKSVMVSSCWSLETKYPISFPVLLNMSIILDKQYNRAKFPDDTNQMDLQKNALTDEQCFEFEVFVKVSLADIFKPIALSLEYDIVEKVPDSEVFCQTCLAVNPYDDNIVRSQVVFSTGCLSDRCVADLKLKSSLENVQIPYIIGSTNYLTVVYHIQNSGETAFLAQLNISIPETVSFSRIPPNCQQYSKNLLCYLNNNSPMYQGNEDIFKLTLDTTKIEGTELYIVANAFSTGDELNEDDNTVEDLIPLGEFSDIEIIGKSTKPSLSLEDGLHVENITHLLEIRNNGPSNIKNLNIVVSIPMSLINPWSLAKENVIDFHDLKLTAYYNNKFLDYEWSQNNIVIIQDPLIPFIPASPVVVVDNLNGMNYDSSKAGYDFENQPQEDPNNDDFGMLSRRKRQAGRYFNKYTQSISYDDNLQSRLKRSASIQTDSFIANLPSEKQIQFDCENLEEGLCIRATMNVQNFIVGNTPILISVQFNLDLNKIQKLLTETRDIFVMKTSAQINKYDDEKGETINVLQQQPYTSVFKQRIYQTPIWIIVVSVIGGILLLILITYGLYKLGFFKRTKKDELNKLVRESQRVQPPEERAITSPDTEEE